MPIVAKSVTEQTTISVPQPSIDKLVLLDTYIVTNLNIDLPPNDLAQSRITCRLERGYRQLGEFTMVETKSIDIRGAGLAKLMNAPVPPGLTYYDAIKQAVYNYLVSTGDIPNGDVV